jgi:hypothetical protein
MNAFPFSRLNDEALDDPFVIIEEYFACDIRIVPMTGVRRSFTVMICTGSYAKQDQLQ